MVKIYLLGRSAVNLAENFGLMEKFAATKFSAKPYLLYLSSVDRKDKEIGRQPNGVRERKVFSDDKIVASTIFILIFAIVLANS